MSDAPKTDAAKKDAPKKDEAVKKKGGLPLGAIGAVVVLLGAGIGIGMFLSSLVTPPKVATVEGGTEGHGATDAGSKGHDDPKAAKHSPLAHSVAFEIGDLMTNVRGQQGRRFIKTNCVLWMDHEVVKKVSAGAGGAAGGGHGAAAGDPAEDVKRILQSSFEEHLKTYELDDLTGINIYKLLERNIKEITERELRILYPDLKADQAMVSRVVLTGMIIQ
jgi:hypothetical protein